MNRKQTLDTLQTVADEAADEFWPPRRRGRNKRKPKRDKKQKPDRSEE